MGDGGTNRYNRIMLALCHRCHADLPHGADVSVRGNDTSLLFCPHCGAPQILLPDHMRLEVVPVGSGVAPPPRPDHAPRTAARPIHWRSALSASVLVAAIAALLAVAGQKYPVASLLGVLWTMMGAVTALSFYSRQTPGAIINGRVGLRIGFATGLLMIAATGCALAFTGVILRFGTHSLASFDAEMAADFKQVSTQVTAWVQQQNQPREAQEKVIGIMNSPEVRAGSRLGTLVLQSVIILLLSAGGGALAGMLRTRRHQPRQVG